MRRLFRRRARASFRGDPRGQNERKIRSRKARLAPGGDLHAQLDPSRRIGPGPGPRRGPAGRYRPACVAHAPGRGHAARRNHQRSEGPLHGDRVRCGRQGCGGRPGGAGHDDRLHPKRRDRSRPPSGDVRLQRRPRRLLLAASHERPRPGDPHARFGRRPQRRRLSREHRQPAGRGRSGVHRSGGHRLLTAAAGRGSEGVLQCLGRRAGGEDDHRRLAQGQPPRGLATVPGGRELRHQPGGEHRRHLPGPAV